MTTITSGDGGDHDHRVATPIGLAALAGMGFSGVDLEPLKRELRARLQAHPDDAAALMDLSTLLQLTGDRASGLAHQAEALRHQQLYRRPPATRSHAGMRVLAFVAPGDLMANTPVEFLLEESEATLDLYYVVPGRPVSQLLPDHDVAFVAIGASDENLPILQQLARLTRCWPVPVLNAPERIVRLSREFVWAHLTCAPGITMPMTARVERQTLAQIGAGAVRVGSVLERGDFPIIVRPVGSHAGQSLARLDDAAGIATYLQGQQESRFHVSRFIDYRGLDGLFRTYRIVFVADRPLPCHMTISESWMVNDPNAGTNADAETRAEDAHFRASFDDVFARRHGAAFRAITERLGLDYFGIDCAETPRGDLLIFEVSTTISGQSMDPLHLYPCTQPQMRKVADAFREMLRATRRASLR